MKIIIFFFFSIFIYNFSLAEEEKLVENFNDWQLFCSNDNNSKSCEIRQIKSSNETNEIISFISLTINPENKAQMLIGLPHMINLKIPTVINVDGENSAEVNITYCNTNACFIAEVLNEEYLDLLKSGNKLEVTTRFITNDSFNMDYSLSGFTVAYNNLLKNL